MPKVIHTPLKDKLSWPISKYTSPANPGHLLGSRAHKQLMQKAIDFLRAQGFNDDQIYTNLGIYTGCRYGTTGVRVIDIVGIKPKKKVAIECGKTSEGLLRMIRPYFDEVLHFPYPRGKSTY